VALGASPTSTAITPAQRRREAGGSGTEGGRGQGRAAALPTRSRRATYRQPTRTPEVRRFHQLISATRKAARSTTRPRTSRPRSDAIPYRASPNHDVRVPHNAGSEAHIWRPFRQLLAAASAPDNRRSVPRGAAVPVRRRCSEREHRTTASGQHLARPIGISCRHEKGTRGAQGGSRVAETAEMSAEG